MGVDETDIGSGSIILGAKQELSHHLSIISLPRHSAVNPFLFVCRSGFLTPHCRVRQNLGAEGRFNGLQKISHGRVGYKVCSALDPDKVRSEGAVQSV